MEVIDDPFATVKKTDTLVFCCGKFYYEMQNEVKNLGVENMAFIRVEQLYHFQKNNLMEYLKNIQMFHLIFGRKRNLQIWGHGATWQ